MRIGLSILVLAVALAGAAAQAQDTPPGNGESRYSFHRTDDGFVRLDNRTGQVSVCSRQTNGWACLAVPDDRAALEAEIGRLQGETAQLKRELLARGLPLPDGMKPEPPTARGSDRPLKLPSDADLDRAMTFLEKAWRRLVEMMANLQKDMREKI